MHGHKNSGRPKDLEVLEQLEEASFFSEYDSTITISAANLRWLVYRAGLWVRRAEENEFNRAK